MKNLINKKKGFTIAEIVLSLLLIAGIAMILTPVIFSDTEDSVLYTSLNKTYTLLQQVHQAESMLEARGKIIGGSQNQKFMSAVSMTLKCIDLNSDGTLVLGSNKFNQYIGNYNTTPNIIAPSNFTIVNLNNSTIILKNGVFVSQLSQDINNDGANEFFIMVDVNGKKRPNTTGRDIFFFQISPNPANGGTVFIPADNNDGNEQCIVGGNVADSLECAKRYLNHGRMN